MAELLKISVIIPTYNRTDSLKYTLDSIAKQTTQPNEIIIVDASADFDNNKYLNVKNLSSKIIHVKAIELGSAKQRNQGVEISNYNIIGFFDDDIIFETDCILHLFNAINSAESAGAVNAMITNQQYQIPGRISSTFYKLMSGSNSNDFAGKCIGPAINFLPADTGNDIKRVEWLNTTCTLYKKEFLPNPIFPPHFTGYSLMEDLTLSLEIAKKSTLYNVGNARIFHDTKPSLGKHGIAELSEMDLVNRYYIMKNVINKTDFMDMFRLFLQQLFSLASCLANIEKAKTIPQILTGKFRGIKRII